MRLKSLDIALFYEHPDAGTWSLLDLQEHRGVIHPGDLEPETFLRAASAIDMYCDRFKRFLHTSALSPAIGGRGRGGREGEEEKGFETRQIPLASEKLYTREDAPKPLTAP